MTWTAARATPYATRPATTRPAGAVAPPADRYPTSPDPAAGYGGAARRRMSALTEVWADCSHAARRRMELDRPWLTAAR